MKDIKDTHDVKYCLDRNRSETFVYSASRDGSKPNTRKEILFERSGSLRSESVFVNVENVFLKDIGSADGFFQSFVLSERKPEEPIFYLMKDGFRRSADDLMEIGNIYNFKVEDFSYLQEANQVEKCYKCSEEIMETFTDSHGNEFCSPECMNEEHYGS